MARIVHNLVQGSDLWHQFRLDHFGASEAAAMLGVSRKVKRNELLHAKKTGIAKEFSDWVQRNILDYGHEVEQMARPIVERMIGMDLYPATYSLGTLSASCDGISIDDTTAFEHKQWNAEYGAIVADGDVPEEHMPQCQQVLLVTGAERLLFVVSDGTEQNFASTWVYPDKAYQDRIMAGWHQFEVDLASFEPAAPVQQTAAAPVESLPSVFVQVSGSLAITDNLAKFGEALRSFIQRTPTKPETDDEFAVCESAIKTLTKAEEALDAAESAALAQVACIDDMRTLKATLKDLARSNRLALEKLVKAEKESRRLAIVTKAQKDLAAFAADLPEAPYMPTPAADFGSAIKGLKTMASIQNAVDTELARVKIEANEIARKIRANLDVINEHPEHRAMFADARALVLKDCDFVALTVKQRIADHVAEIAKREEETRARIQAEEEAKAKAEADRIIEAERAKIRAAESAQAVEAPVIAAATVAVVQPASSRAAAPSLSLGSISKRLGFTVSREFLAAIGFEGTKDRAAYLYHEEDFRMICSAIADHVMSVANETNQKAA